MRDDLSGLRIYSADIYSASGMDDVVEALCEYATSSYRTAGMRLKLFASLAALGLGWCAFYHFLYIGRQLPYAFLWLILAAGFLGASRIDIRGRFVLKNFGRETHRRYLEFNRSPVLKRLCDEAEKFNQVVRAIELADELAELDVDAAAIEKRDRVLQSLAQTRANLIRALKLDRLRREFADVQNGVVQNLNLELSSVEATRAIGKLEHDASAYGKTMNDAIELGVSVQEEILKLQKQDRERRG